MKKSKRKPIKESRFLGFNNNRDKTTDKTSNDLVKLLITLIEMDKQYKKMLDRQQRKGGSDST